MRILHVSRSDDEPGANRAAMRLHRALGALPGIESTFAVLRQQTDDGTVARRRRGAGRIAARLAEQLSSRWLKQDGFALFSFGWSDSMDLPREYLAHFDLVQLHWLGAATWDLGSLGGFAGPVVWRLPDMYPLTGGCHYAGTCTQFVSGCRACEQLRVPALIRLLYARKRSRLAALDNLHTVAPSRWLHRQAAHADLLRHATHHYLPTGVDTERYKPSDRRSALDLLGLEALAAKQIVVFGAAHATSDRRKGYGELLAALRAFAREPAARDVHYLVFGSSGDAAVEREFGNLSFLGRLTDDAALALVYNVAEVLMVPSLEDNLPNTALEALACGTPVVGFDVGGMPDLIEHRGNGYLAPPYRIDELVAGLKWALRPPDRDAIRASARARIVQGFAQRDVALRYRELYARLLAARS